jgi:DNA-binding transcriptional MocR family regulator
VHLPGSTAEGVEAGLHLLVRLPADADEAALVAAARRLGVHVAGLAGYHHDLDAGGPGLVIGYGKAPEHRIADGVARLAAAYRATRAADPVADRPPGGTRSSRLRIVFADRRPWRRRPATT